MKKIKVLAVTGIRSEYDIIFPVLKELQNNQIDLSLVVSGAHLSDQHGMTQNKIIEDGFTIVDRIDSLLSTDRSVQRSKGVSLLVQGLTQTVERERPDFLIVVGDREESIATAIVGNYMECLVVHLAGGDSTYGNADDPIRFAVSKLAHVHCTFAQQYADNLIKIGEEDFRVFWTGNSSYVNIQMVPTLTLAQLSQQLPSELDKYIVLIQHPLSSEVEGSYSQMIATLEAVKTFNVNHDYKVVCIPPNSDPGSFEMKQALDEYDSEDSFVFCETLNRLLFVNLIRNARALIGNSSMGILEAPFYKLPVINVGNRQKGRLNAGNVEFVEHNSTLILKALEKACLDERYREKVSGLENPYGDASAAKNIVKVISEIDLNDRKWYVKRKLC